jgi:hypothetical protein
MTTVIAACALTPALLTRLHAEAVGKKRKTEKKFKF